jgi:hypothetical protein
MSECVTLLVASQFAEVIEAVNSLAVLSASTPKLISFWLILIPTRGSGTDPNL